MKERAVLYLEGKTTMVWLDKMQLELQWHNYTHDYDELDCDDNSDNV